MDKEVAVAVDKMAAVAVDMGAASDEEEAVATKVSRFTFHYIRIWRFVVFSLCWSQKK